MKAMVCEMCGGQEIVKQDGMYVCQNCGTKYSVEEAKKIFVQIDTSSQLANLYELARRAKDTNNSEDAKNYYGQIVVLDPKSWEAYFYSVYYSQLTKKVYQITDSLNNISNAIKPTFELIKATVPQENQEKAYKEVGTHCYASIETMMGSGAKHLDLDEECSATNAALSLVNNCAVALDECGVKDLALEYYKYIIDTTKRINKVVPYRVKNRIVFPDLNYIQQRINALEPSNGQQSSAGCYVATAVYGSYDCPQVWTLRRYRDYTLAETWPGRLFIYLYYAISPTLVKWFGEAQWFKKMWKPKLDRMVKRLNNDGVANTPYQDRQW